MTWNIILHILMVVVFLYALGKLIGLAIWFASRFICELKMNNEFIVFFVRIINFFVLVFGFLTLFAIECGLFALFFMIGIK